jgi:hypothetical protein
MEISDNKAEVGKERGASVTSVDLAGRKTEQKYVLKSSAFSLGDVAVRLLKVITEFIVDRR